MFHHYFAEQDMAFRQRELRSAAERAGITGIRSRSHRRRAAGVARVLRTVADRLDSPSR